MGVSALGTDTKGNRNTAVGSFTLQTQNFTTTTNSYNTAFGYGAGSNVTTGLNNVLIGGLTGDAITTANNNVAVGNFALTANQTGAQNTAVGTQSLKACTGADNTAVGMNAGLAIAGGSNNTTVGSLAGNQITSGGNNTAIGKDALRSGSPGGAVTTGSNVIGLGDENISSFNCQVALTVASDERDKTDFVDLDLGLDFVKALEPVTYYWDKRSKYGDKTAEDYDLNAQTSDGTHKEDWMDVGFKAQSVQALEEAAGYKLSDKKNLTVSLSADEKQYGLRYEKFVPILVKAIQDQDAIIQSLTARIAALES